MAEFSRATRQAKPSSQLTLRERIAAERERGAAALERSGELLAAIEGKPALAEAYRRFFARLNDVATAAEALEREIRRFAEQIGGSDAGL